MGTITIDKNNWRDYFNQVTDVVKGKQSSMEIDSLEVGSQTEVEDMPLLGISYDEKGKAVNIFFQSIEHNVLSPESIHIQEEGGAVKSIEFKQTDGTVQILKLKEPIMLPKQ